MFNLLGRGEPVIFVEFQVDACGDVYRDITLLVTAFMEGRECN